MKKYFSQMGLQSQILIPTVFIVVVTGMALNVQSNLRIQKIFQKEFESKGKALCKVLADNAQDALMSKDPSKLQGHIDEYRKTDGVDYVYVTDAQNKVIVHTFSPAFPEGFQNLNPTAPGSSAIQVKTIETKDVYAMDIACPILAGVLGTAHIGMDLKLESAQVRANNLYSLIMVLLILSLGLGSLSYFILLRVKVLRQTIAKLKDIAQGEGDLTQRLEVTGRDEIGQMAAAFNTFAEKMQGMIQGIGVNIQQLLTASTQLIQTAQGMARATQETSLKSAAVSEGAGQVSQNLQTVSNTTQSMNAGIKEIALSAGQAAEYANNAVQMAQGTQSTVARLGKSGEEIDEVTRAISDIASQTTFLALNANLEAVRAGIAGKGFAIVAAQVRDLATQTTNLAGEIGGKITKIQADTRSSIAAITQIREAINQINDISGSIATEVTEQSVATNEIERSISLATAASTEIADNVSNVAETAQNTFRGAEDVQKAAAGLSKIASGLRKLVDQFKY
jgi:methyl-accepting chemotaxis protein